MIGGGAAGLMAAAQAAQHGHYVTVFERNVRPGRKLAMTGNGKCNFTNTAIDMKGYHGTAPDFAEKVLRRFDAEAAIAYFRRIGVEPKVKDGLVYPLSMQAQAVSDALIDHANQLGVQFKCSCFVTDITREQGFVVTWENTGTDTPQESEHFSQSFDRVILTAGSKAAPKTGSDGSGYAMVRKFGHGLVPVVPALTGLKCDGGIWHTLSGLRCEARVTLSIDGERTAADTGEVQFTDYGISGIPVFQISAFAARALYQRKQTAVYISFFPELEREDVEKLLTERKAAFSGRSMGRFFIGLLPEKTAQAILIMANIDARMPAGRLNAKQLRAMAGLLTSFKAVITGTNGFQNAQCASGGIETRDIDPETMQSGLVRGLYFAGEILDIDGICGGYNLQFAWSTGYIAGHAAGDYR